jgi:hypothetical protein
VTYWFAVGQLSCAVVSDGQVETPDGRAVIDTGLGARGATWSGELTFPAATGFAHAAEVAFWSASGRSPQDDEHRPAALEAIRLFGDRLRPFESGEEVLPHERDRVEVQGRAPEASRLAASRRAK